jgi:GAF domain-containing protein
MDPATFHDRLSELTPALLATGDEAISAVEAHAASGCSRCARAVYNARESAVELSATAPPAAPPSRLRARVLGSARGSLAARAGAPRPRFFDASGEQARLHLRDPRDPARLAAVEALGLGTVEEPGGPVGRLLAELQAEIGFPLLFVSIVRGARVGYRAQCGLPVGTTVHDRRREGTFCTHVVASDAPLLVPDAAAEPFFRGSSMVRDGVRAYAGVPLIARSGATPAGLVLGTVCAMDVRPRPLGADLVRALERCAARVAAVVESA